MESKSFTDGEDAEEEDFFAFLFLSRLALKRDAVVGGWME
jgi:hypothetical protein